MPFFCIHCRSEIDAKYKACPYCGEPITDFLRRYLEHPIDGKYQILARLGVGGMGEVYKVLHLHLNSIRVIKLMRASIAGEAGADDRFIREARLATRINHPNVAALYDFSTLDDGSRYMVWEYIEGTNLHELIETNGPLSPRYAAKLAIEALHGLDAIHRAGIVHRDISPENIMICRDEEGEQHVKLIDLGIAKQGDATDASKTATGMFVGKWKYCSPEHLGMLDAGERIDGRADLYSFGIVLYEMLTGVPPFQADTPHAYLMLHSSEKPRALADVNPTMPSSPKLEALIFRALEKDRRKRFASAREFARALEEIEPELDDQVGAAQPLPRAVEITEEPTKVATPTSLSGAPAKAPATDPNAVTVLTDHGRPVANRELRKVSTTNVVPLPPPPRPRLRWVWIVVVAALAGLIAAAIVNRYRSVAERNAVTETAAVSTATPASAAQGRVALNAFPWGEVSSIRNVATGSEIDLKEKVVTPASVDLSPGTYEITLSNPSFRSPVTRKIEVKPGEEQLVNLQFADPATASLPRFEGATR
ncbi:MAG: eukaryotic-like serine/threonine-protein kinase [Thermoanaerobaculia bacterium]|jgi:serine/threonine-protein kinase|nr:eukaryotic-like serine/threonine-protein kinase [Thermoanaerobaculia bacterium]